MSHIAYKLALIRQDQLLREAADRRLTSDRASSADRAAGIAAIVRSLRLPRLEWLVRSSHASSRRTARGH